MSLSHWVVLVLIGAAFGSSFGFNAFLLSDYGPLTVSAVRVGFGALGCWIWVLASGREVSPRKAKIVGLGVFGAFQYAAPFALLPFAQQHVTSSVAGIANAMTPVAVVAISHFWPGGERATLNKAIGIAFGICGIAFLFTRGSEIGATEPAFVLVAALAPVCYGIALNLVRQFRGEDPFVMTACAMTGGAIIIVPLALLVEGVPPTPSPEAAGAFLVLGFALTSVAFLVMYAILPKVGAVNLSLVTFVAPISATLIGAGIFGEAIASAHLVGMALILAGLVAVDGRIGETFRQYRHRRALRLGQAPLSGRPMAGR